MKFMCKKSEKSGNIVIGPVRLAFESLNEPKQNDDGKDKWGGCFLIPEGADVSALTDAIEDASKEKWNGKPPRFKHGMPVKDQKDLVTAEGDMYDFCEEGSMFFNANANEEVKVYDGQRLQITDEKEIYGGMWVIASLRPYAYDHAKNKGLGIGLQQLQKVKDDDRLGRPVSKAEDDFEEFEVDSDGDTNSIFD